MAAFASSLSLNLERRLERLLRDQDLRHRAGPLVQSTANQRGDVVRHKWFHQEPIGPECGQRPPFVRPSGPREDNDGHRCRARALAQMLGESHAVDSRQSQIQNGHGRGFAVERLERHRAIGNALDFRVGKLLSQNESQKLAGIVVVLGDENPFRLEAATPRIGQVPTKSIDRRGAIEGVLRQRMQERAIQLLGETGRNLLGAGAGFMTC